jgi:hypothetical protein
MEFATDNLLARVLLTLVTLGYSVVPVFADFNRTHATNPLWTPHARFHVVWQVSSYCGIGLIALFLIWTAGPAAKLWLAVGLAAAVYAGFFVTVLAMPRFGGTLADTNGVPPLGTVSIGGQRIVLDANLTVFGVLVAILLLAALLIR